jgi:hypothetical protein
MSNEQYQVARREDLDAFGQVCPRTLSARDVLDLHADLQRELARPEIWYREGLLDYAVRDVGDKPQWMASHLHPSTSMKNLEPWLASLGTDLFGATTYQVTAEMIDLAEALAEANPSIGAIQKEDLPSDYGFMWLDKPIPRPSLEDGDRDPLLMHAVSWALVPAMPVRIGDSESGRLHDRHGLIGFTGVMPAIRVREWGYNNSPDVRPRPLHLMGQATIPITGGVYTNLKEHWHVHMLWILMGMEITAIRTELPGRQGAKRAATLKHKLIRVVTLRRPEHKDSGKSSATPRHIDWSCTWLVRGHYRKAPHGGTFADGRDETWVRPHIKGPDGLPLRARDILYRLAR